MLNIKKSTFLNIKDFYLGTYWHGGKEITTLLIHINNYGFKDFDNDRGVNIGNIGYLEPLSKYVNFDEECISVKTAKEISVKYFSKFNRDNVGKPKRWEPKVSIADAIPYLQITNSFVEDDIDLGI